MGSEQNDSTSFSPSEPKLCINGCGFFGSAANMDLCSKCFRDLRVMEEQAASAKAAVEKSLNPKPKAHEEKKADVESSAVETVAGSTSEVVVLGDRNEPPPRVPNRCFTCNKKVGLTGFKCKCGSTYCGVHRYPEKHDCSFDFKGSGRDAIAKANPVVKADKVERI